MTRTSHGLVLGFSCPLPSRLRAGLGDQPHLLEPGRISLKVEPPELGAAIAAAKRNRSSSVATDSRHSGGCAGASRANACAVLRPGDEGKRAKARDVRDNSA